MNEDFSTRGRLQDLGRWYVNGFVRSVAKSLSSGALVLDAGAGEGVYRSWFSHCEYRAIDLAVGESKWNYSHLDFVGPLHAMPIGDRAFDAVLCTQVLEHLELPLESLKEMHRVLRPGGRLFLTVPMAQNEHQVPYDFFRYTSYGLRSLCSRAGFSQVDVEPFGGMWARWAYELPRALRLLPPTGLRRGEISPVGVGLLPISLASRAVVRGLQGVFLLLDRVDADKSDPWGWSCVAMKAASS